MHIKNIWYGVGIILFASTLLSLPQFFLQNMIIGSDAVFHFNRFYETSQQIKEGHFSYFMSLYGFQQSARIILPLYSPLYSYLFGGMLLLCGTWFKFQLFSSFLLFFCSGLFLFLLLLKMRVIDTLALKLSLIYMTTYSIAYWVIRQGYSSWGAVFLPLCIIPLVDLVNDKRFNTFKIAISVSIMVQLHFISSIFLVLLYFFAFIYAFCSTEKTSRGYLLIKLIQSIFIFGLFTFNIWFSLYHVYTNNDIVQPFVNTDIYKTTITWNSWYWLVNPLILPVVILLCLVVMVKKWKYMSSLNQYFSLSATVFILLSSNVFPWQFLYNHHIKLIDTIQFPFRFFIPATVCFLCSLGLSVSEGLVRLKSNKIQWIVILICFIQSIFLFTNSLLIFNGKDLSFQLEDTHQFVYSKDNEKIKAAFHSKDLANALQLIQKSTPDYLPVYGKSNDNKYQLYEKNILCSEQNFTKHVNQKNHLVIQWQQNQSDSKKIIVPIVVYDNTVIHFNGKKLTKIMLTPIGNPIVQSKEGENTIEVSYDIFH